MARLRKPHRPLGAPRANEPLARRAACDCDSAARTKAAMRQLGVIFQRLDEMLSVSGFQLDLWVRAAKLSIFRYKWLAPFRLQHNGFSSYRGMQGWHLAQKIPAQALQFQYVCCMHTGAGRRYYKYRAPCWSMVIAKPAPVSNFNE